MSQFDIFENSSFNQLELLMTSAAHQILQGCEFDEFAESLMLMAKATAHDMFPKMDDEQREKCFFWVFVNLWNVAPLPHNAFQPDPIELPEMNERCLCGSGKKFGQCCNGLDMAEQPPRDFFWPFIARIWSKKTLLDYARRCAFPLEGAAIVADVLSQEGHSASAIKVLNPYLNGSAEGLDRSHSGVVDLYCDLCDEHYATDRTKLNFLSRMVEHRDEVIQAEAWQRFASYYQDRGDIEASRNALAEAMRADPGNPSHSLLELVLLISGGELEQARQRANFWLHSFRKREEEFPELVQTLREARKDPAAALGSLMIGERAGDVASDPLYRISNACREACNAPMAHYALEILPGPPEEGNFGRLVSPAKVQAAEEGWRAVNPLLHNFDEPGDVWHSDAKWLRFLETQAGAWDSINVLADLLDLICNSPYAESPIDTLDISQMIAERAVSVSRQVALKNGTTLPWVVVENRPLLQALNHLINICTVKDLEQEAILCAEEYIALNPNDNHGFRSFLMNYYVEQALDDKGLALAEKFADDGSPDTLYGTVLMYYRAGNLQMAQTMLEAALEHLPKVASYLVKSKVKKPPMNDFGIQFGGDDQAWLYRDTMRHVWLATPGCIEWLKKQMQAHK